MDNSKDQKCKNLSLKSYIDGPLLQNNNNNNNVDASTLMSMVAIVVYESYYYCPGLLLFFSTDNKFVYVRGSHKPHSNQFFPCIYLPYCGRFDVLFLWDGFNNLEIRMDPAEDFIAYCFDKYSFAPFYKCDIFPFRLSAFYFWL